MICSAWSLAVSCFVCSAISIGTISLAVGTDRWLIVHERLALTYSVDFVVNCNLTVWIGLWRYCTTSSCPPMRAFEEEDEPDNYTYSHTYDLVIEPEGEAVEEPVDPTTCIMLEYNEFFMKRPPREENNYGSTVIAEAQRGATPFFVLSLVLSVASGVLSVIGNLQKTYKTVVSAIFSIICGLSLAVGTVLYITFINDEASHTKPNSFSYTYGWSMIFMGLSFLSSESSAIFCITIFLKRNNKVNDLVKIIPGLRDKVKEDLVVCVSEKETMDTTKNEVVNYNSTLIL